MQPVKGGEVKITNASLLRSSEDTLSLQRIAAGEASAHESLLAMTLVEGVDLERILKVTGSETLASNRSALAADIISTRSLNYGTINIPDEILDVLENTQFIRLARESGFEPLITSGLAAGLYGSPRAISVDIDFTMRDAKTMEGDLKSLLDRVTSKSTELIHLPKSFAPCLGIFTKIPSPGLGGDSAVGTDVDLDGLAICRFRPAPQGFAFEFSIDRHDLLCCRTVQLPNGNTIGLVPPEHVLFYKLLAARGVDVGKYDLIDAGAIIINAQIDPQMVLKLITRQVYQSTRGFENLDPNRLFALADSYGNVGEKTNEALIEAGLARRDIRDGVLSWLERASEKEGLSKFDSRDARFLIVSTIKQSALVSRLLDSLDKTTDSLTEMVPSSSNGPKVSLASSDNLSRFSSNAALLRATLGLCTPEFLLQQGLNGDLSPLSNHRIA
jgi:hypothetical protein